MSTSDKVKAVLSCTGKKQVELADYLGMRKQNLATKMMRDSWSAGDLVKVANFTGAKVGFILPDGTCIYLDSNTGEEQDNDPQCEE